MRLSNLSIHNSLNSGEKFEGLTCNLLLKI